LEEKSTGFISHAALLTALLTMDSFTLSLIPSLSHPSFYPLSLPIPISFFSRAPPTLGSILPSSFPLFLSETKFSPPLGLRYPSPRPNSTEICLTFPSPIPLPCGFPPPSGSLLLVRFSFPPFFTTASTFPFEAVLPRLPTLPQHPPHSCFICGISFFHWWHLYLFPPLRWCVFYTLSLSQFHQETLLAVFRWED